MSRTEIVHIRVAPEVKEAIERAAKKDQRTVSDWCAVQLAAIIDGKRKVKR